VAICLPVWETWFALVLIPLTQPWLAAIKSCRLLPVPGIMILMVTMATRIITTAGTSTTMGTAAATIMTRRAATLHAVTVMGKVAAIPVYTVVDIDLKK
jgi:hypothetical protein